MFKATAKLKDGRMLLVCGLSDLNLARLKEKLPIVFDADSLGIAAKVLIFHGENENAILAELKAAGIQFPPTQADGTPPHE